MTSLDRNSPVPLYYQVKQILLEKLDKGIWKPGDLVPSEQELQEHGSVPKEMGTEDVEAEALKPDAVQRALGGAMPKKVIVVPGRIVNVVV